jgi:hypothetical protein
VVSANTRFSSSFTPTLNERRPGLAPKANRRLESLMGVTRLDEPFTAQARHFSYAGAAEVWYGTYG